MAAIPTLLNPMPDTNGEDSHDEDTHSSNVSAASEEPDAQTTGHPSRKKQKICKDAAVFKPGPIRGECRYPPCEDQDDVLATQHQLFDVYPIGDIATYPRHIPYNSEKKTFMEKTGRECFEVFQYQFRIPGDTITYTILWDYNNGLVRTTPLFKCGNYSKTTPAKMLARNVGLREICHSITGGALVAQGYWIPFEAAKAVAATFCWTIRHALTPVFGIDFPGLCLPPDDEHYGSMHIDPEITRRCTVQMETYRQLARQEKPALTSPRSPHTPLFRPALPKIVPRPHALRVSPSDCSSDAGREDRYALSSPSPQNAYTNPWSAVNTPRSPSPKISFTDPWSPATTTRSESPRGSSRKGRAANIPRSHPRLDLAPPPRTPPSRGACGMSAATDRNGAASEGSSPEELSPRSTPRGASRDVDEDYDGGSDDSATHPGNGVRGRKKSSRGFTEAKAAYALLKLSTQRAGAPDGLRPLKRRASA